MAEINKPLTVKNALDCIDIWISEGSIEKAIKGLKEILAFEVNNKRAQAMLTKALKMRETLISDELGLSSFSDMGYGGEETEEDEQDNYQEEEESEDSNHESDNQFNFEKNSDHYTNENEGSESYIINTLNKFKVNAENITQNIGSIFFKEKDLSSGNRKGLSLTIKDKRRDLLQSFTFHSVFILALFGLISFGVISAYQHMKSQTEKIIVLESETLNRTDESIINRDNIRKQDLAYINEKVIEFKKKNKSYPLNKEMEVIYKKLNLNDSLAKDNYIYFKGSNYYVLSSKLESGEFHIISSLPKKILKAAEYYRNLNRKLFVF